MAQNTPNEAGKIALRVEHSFDRVRNRTAGEQVNLDRFIAGSADKPLKPVVVEADGDSEAATTRTTERTTAAV